jgi:hypothetical protein
MTFDDGHTLSLEEISTALAAYAGPPRARRRSARKTWMSRRLGLAIAFVVLIIAGCSYAVDFNPFRGLSAAEHPAGAKDSLPAFLKTEIAEWNERYRKSPRRHLLPTTARFVRRVPDGMGFYTIATQSGKLCLAVTHPPKSTLPGGLSSQGGFDCGYSLSRSQPITFMDEQNSFNNVVGKDDNYGLALDGIRAITFIGGRLRLTVPVKDNVWAHVGPLGSQEVILHWDDGATQRLWSSPVNGRWIAHRPRSSLGY